MLSLLSSCQSYSLATAPRFTATTRVAQPLMAEFTFEGPQGVVGWTGVAKTGSAAGLGNFKAPKKSYVAPAKSFDSPHAYVDDQFRFGAAAGADDKPQTIGLPLTSGKAK